MAHKETITTNNIIVCSRAAGQLYKSHMRPAGNVVSTTAQDGTVNDLEMVKFPVKFNNISIELLGLSESVDLSQ